MCLLYAGLYMRTGICPTLQPSWSSLIIGMKSVFMSKMSCDSFSCNYVWDEECFHVKDELWYPFCNYIWASNMSSIMNKLFCLMVPIWKMTTTFYMPFYWFFVKQTKGGFSLWLYCALMLWYVHWPSAPDWRSLVLDASM